VIVVDASDDWRASRDRVLAEVAPEAPNVEWIYLGTDVRSATHQRNLGFARCSGEVVFFLDDDSFMYRDCAEQIMRVYERDAEEEIGGVCAVLADRLEGAQEAGHSGMPSNREGLKNQLLFLAHRQWWQDKLCIPYDGRFHLRDVGGPDVVPVPLFHGCRMTFRTESVRRAGGFEEMLVGAAYGEDIDLSYRVSREQGLVEAQKARLRHEQVPVARPKRALNTSLVLLNAIALYKLNEQRDRAPYAAYAFLAKRAMLEFVRDCMRPRRWMPYTTGVLRAARFVPTVLSLEGDALRREYVGIQRRLYTS
jgi:GT2 family glycosyltransferase